MTPARLKKIAILLVKLAISLAILKFLVDLAGNESFSALRDQPKDWGRLALAWPLVLAAVLLTFFRWMLLVQALGMDFGPRDALRLGFLGYLFNFVSLGSVGGDLFKAVFIAREQHGRRAEAVATVVIDRLVGLYGLFVVSALAVLWAGLYAEPDLKVRTIARVSLWCAGLGAVGLAALMLPGMTGSRAIGTFERLPVVGPIAVKLVLALRLYREQYHVVIAAIVMSLGVHTLMAVAFYMLSGALPGASPTLAEHLVIVPLGLLAAAVPLPMAGLGAFEGALDFLYYYIGHSVGVTFGRGLIVALGYRLLTVLVALLGVVYYFKSRRAIDEAMHQAEQEVEAEQEAEANESTAPPEPAAGESAADTP